MKDKELVIEAIKEKKKHLVVGTAPSIRIALGEEFGLEPGTNVKGKMIASLKALGFNKVFDVDLAADLTIMEEGTEFIEFHKMGKKPLISSCCPASLRFIKKSFPEYTSHLSTTKSPQQIFGTICKTYYADKYGISPNDVFVVTVMPCIVKKTERIETKNDIIKPYDVDAVITTKELAELIRENNIDFNNLEDSSYDEPFNQGHSVIFGASGGVTESMVRLLADKIDEANIDEIKLKDVRYNNDIKELTYTIGASEIKTAIVSGLNNVKSLLEKVKNGEEVYDFIEVMACPGGCVNGAGQPLIKENREENIKKRQNGLYQLKETEKIDKPLENNMISDLYDRYFKEGKYTHEILHTRHED